MRLHLLTCGYTHAPAGMALRGAGRRTLRFPALVAVVEHPSGPIVVDTGYAPRVLTALRRPADRAYGTVLPVTLGPGEAMIDQLPGIGIDPADIRTVVLTHLHADHVAGLHDLPNAQVVFEPEALATARSWRGLTRMRSGYIPALIPDDLEILDPTTLPTIDVIPTLGPGRDLTGDGAVVAFSLPGHHPGHQGVLIRTGARDVLLVGDAVWDLDTVTSRRLPSRVVAIATHHWSQYVATVDALHETWVADPSMLIVPSHDEQAIAVARDALL